jgi:carbonic anhydrase
MSIRIPAFYLLRTGALYLPILIAGLAILIGGIAGAAPTVPSIPPDQALQRLLDGNQRYVKNQAQRPDQRPIDAPQHPFAVILSCSDSRVPPEILFDQGVGALFVVRVAGNTYDALALATIEYAIAHLGSTLIMVIGHDHCGAVRAALDAYPNPNAGPMLTNIYPAVREAEHKPGDKLSNTVNFNAILTSRRLAGEPAFAAKVKAGEIKIVPARYNLGTGEIKLLH